MLQIFKFVFLALILLNDVINNGLHCKYFLSYYNIIVMLINRITRYYFTSVSTQNFSPLDIFRERSKNY